MVLHEVLCMQVLHHIARRLESMHNAGWAHLDLKPGNVLRRPVKHAWTLIDFGCSAKIGALAGYSSQSHTQNHRL
jgi:serine/threonine protein kinase